MCAMVVDRGNLQYRLKNLGGSTTAVNTTTALIDQNTDEVNTTLARRRSTILGATPDAVNSPRVNNIGNIANLTYKVIDSVNFLWGYEVSYEDIRQLILLIDSKSTYQDRKILLQELRLKYGDFMTASLLSQTISIFRGAGLLKATRQLMEGPAVFGRSKFGTFVFGDAHVIQDYDISKQLPGISPVQAYELMGRNSKNSSVRINRLRVRTLP